jgi:hypothetical protein
MAPYRMAIICKRHEMYGKSVCKAGDTGMFGVHNAPVASEVTWVSPQGSNMEGTKMMSHAA